MGESVKLSRCCGAPIIVEVRSDLPNFTDDEYDLQIPFRICSRCGAIIINDSFQGREDVHADGEDNQLQSPS